MIFLSTPPRRLYACDLTHVICAVDTHRYSVSCSLRNGLHVRCVLQTGMFGSLICTNSCCVLAGYSPILLYLVFSYRTHSSCCLCHPASRALGCLIGYLAASVFNIYYLRCVAVTFFNLSHMNWPGWVDAAAVLLIVIVSFDCLPSRLVLLPGSCCLKELLLRVCVCVCLRVCVCVF